MTGDEFKQLRKDCGLSLNEVARRLSVGARSVARWEKGDRQIPASAAQVAIERFVIARLKIL